MLEIPPKKRERRAPKQTNDPFNGILKLLVSRNMKWKFGNMGSLNLWNFEILKPRNFETKKPRTQETKKPRNQEAKNQQTKKPINFFK